MKTLAHNIAICRGARWLGVDRSFYNDIYLNCIERISVVGSSMLRYDEMLAIEGGTIDRQDPFVHFLAGCLCNLLHHNRLACDVFSVLRNVNFPRLLAAMARHKLRHLINTTI